MKRILLKEHTYYLYAETLIKSSARDYASCGYIREEDPILAFSVESLEEAVDQDSFNLTWEKANATTYTEQQFRMRVLPLLEKYGALKTRSYEIAVICETERVIFNIKSTENA
jgi:hypothetical protein